MSFFQRFLVILVAFALAPAALLGAWILNSTAAARGNAKRFHLQITGLSAQMAETSALEMNRALGFVEDLERNTKADDSRDYKILQQAAAGHSELEYLSIFTSSNAQKMPLADPDLFSQKLDTSAINAAPLVAQALKSGKAQLGAISIHAGIPLVSLAYPLSNGTCLYVEYSLKDLWKKLNQIRLGKSGHLILMDYQGKKT